MSGLGVYETDFSAASAMWEMIDPLCEKCFSPPPSSHFYPLISAAVWTTDKYFLIFALRHIHQVVLKKSNTLFFETCYILQDNN